MKQSRRQELKTNELSIYLQQIYDFLARNSTYVIGGLVVVALIIVVGTMNARSQRAARVDALNRLSSIQTSDGARDIKVLDEIKDLAASYGSDDGLGPEIRDMQATLAHQLALNLTTDADKNQRADLLKEARSACEQAIRDFRSRPEVVARAHFTSAGVEETLFIDGQNSWSEEERKEKMAAIRSLYQKVIDATANPYQQLAKEQLDSLEKRLARLEIVATRPADTAPAATTRPAATKPVVISTKPAPETPKPTVVPTKPAATKAATNGKPATAKPATKPAK